LIGELKSIRLALERVVKLLTPTKDDGTPADTGKPAAPQSAPPGSTSVPGIDPGSGIGAIQATNERLRATLQKTGTGVGAIATGVLGVIGYTRADDIFPFPPHHPSWLPWLTGAAAGSALLATALLITRFYGAQRRVLIGSDLSGPPFYAWRTRRLINTRARKMCNELGVASLQALDLRSDRLARFAHVLDRVHDSASGDVPAHPENARIAALARREAQRLQDTLRLSLTQIGAFILERRTRGAMGGLLSYLLILVAVVGVAFTFAIGDWAKGRRAQAPAPATTTITTVKTTTTPTSSISITTVVTKPSK
jgi:hypothetical protein